MEILQVLPLTDNGMDLMTIGLLVLLAVILFVGLNTRNDKFRNRRKKQRRIYGDRRHNIVGRRKKMEFQHENQLRERRYHDSDRRVGPDERRHRKRRAEDRVEAAN